MAESGACRPNTFDAEGCIRGDSGCDPVEQRRAKNKGARPRVASFAILAMLRSRVPPMVGHTTFSLLIVGFLHLFIQQAGNVQYS